MEMEPKLPISERMKRDTCFYCQKQGHWALYCPAKPMNKSEPSSAGPTIPNDGDIPNKQCPCGGGTCIVKTSHTERNPGRKFYKCPGKPGRNCNFFEWCDTVTSDKREDVQECPYPMCSCGAGICSRLTVKIGVNKGRKFFVCPVKMGACKFFQWQETPRNANSDGHIDESKHFSSPQSTLDSQEMSWEANDDADKDGDGNKLDSQEMSWEANDDADKDGDGNKLDNQEMSWETNETLDSQEMSWEINDDADKDGDGNKCDSIDDALLPPIRNLRLSEEEMPVPVIANGLIPPHCT